MRVVQSILFVCILASAAFATGGDMGGVDQNGSADHPWLIEDVNDFHEFTSDENYWDDHTRLDCDLDLGPTLPGRQIYTTAIIAPDIDNATNHFQGTEFEGSFDGNGHIVSNLMIDADTKIYTDCADNEYLGLFGQIGEGGHVKNLRVVQADIVGGLCSDHIGVLCGFNDGGTISSSYTNGSVTGKRHAIGGLCGTNQNGTIENCYSSSNVTGSTDAANLGGLCGANGGTINNCYATGTVTGNSTLGSSLGGLCGVNDGTISNCYATGTVAGNSTLGGLCGWNLYSGIIDNCYSSGVVSGRVGLGGALWRK